MEHGVRYVVVRVETAIGGVDNVAQAVEQALRAHKRSVSFSRASFPTFRHVEVKSVLLGYQYERLRDGALQQVD